MNVWYEESSYCMWRSQTCSDLCYDDITINVSCKTGFLLSYIGGLHFLAAPPKRWATDGEYQKICSIDSVSLWQSLHRDDCSHFVFKTYIFFSFTLVLISRHGEIVLLISQNVEIYNSRHYVILVCRPVTKKLSLFLFKFRL